ncbi:MAG TPA: DUF4345 domain-containing protein [Puia sp.]|nr:DUF4345 domain-containing protein [Puia sp.]
MEIALKILLGLATLICFLGGLNLLTKGTKAYLPETVPPQRRLDNIFRFLSGIYFGIGFMLAWVIFHTVQVGDLLYFIGVAIAFSGLGRLYSRIQVGSPGTYYDTMMILEISLGAAIFVLHYCSN